MLLDLLLILSGLLNRLILLGIMQSLQVLHLRSFLRVHLVFLMTRVGQRLRWRIAGGHVRWRWRVLIDVSDGWRERHYSFSMLKKSIETTKLCNGQTRRVGVERRMRQFELEKERFSRVIQGPRLEGPCTLVIEFASVCEAIQRCKGMNVQGITSPPPPPSSMPSTPHGPSPERSIPSSTSCSRPC